MRSPASESKPISQGASAKLQIYKTRRIAKKAGALTREAYLGLAESRLKLLLATADPPERPSGV